ncbi:methyltransferase domain-containing protein [Candidatus Woesearchaeota archaeon]|nr:methyltransferase domain-containing protein [Candidatus Woesearchaeota archaeon]
MTEQTNEDIRWANYREANGRFPHVRLAEMKETLKRANVHQGETVLEVGTGNGYLTFPLASAAGWKGKILTFDTTHKNLAAMMLRNIDALQIIPIPQSTSYLFPVPEGHADAIVTLATFHHYDERSTGTTGRMKALREFYRMLKPGGRLVIADPAKGTPTQRYFDAVDTPVHCHPRGHPHDFVAKEEMLTLCKNAGFKDAQFEVVETPWVFNDEEEAKTFIHQLHNSQCTPEESLALAKKHLNYELTAEGVKLGWSLFYLVAKK